ncbi:hypothetical protein K6119_00620 [Paracrocinitomix mangrovi]|uniref:hypothetical protein n=1 Tax=Paracrocinitomix mangrovi TaxID=2862509 RepID=UPI001C8CF39D|nr:hypothetical protein [Paracrocinitomix mangrovi]UKN02018.1 hypothetical protein K6119_00620 [Paracrocinitomix mangrovi]
MNSEDTIDQVRENETQKSLVNLIAVGGFLWFFLSSLVYLISLIIKAAGVISNLSPNGIFWIENILSIVIIGIVAFQLTRRYWQKAQENSLNTKILLIKLGVAILITHVLQYLHVYYIMGYIYDNFFDNLNAYKQFVNESYGYSILDVAFGLMGTIILLLLLIKWK